MARIGIYGGNYNPVHKAHLMVAKAALEQCGLDEVWLMPAYVQPFKQDKKSADAFDRIKMLELAVRNEPGIRVSDFEIQRQGVSYTAVTMSELDRSHPEDEFFFIMGADSVHTFLTWYHPELIVKHAALIVAGRRENAQKRDGLMILDEQTEMEELLISTDDESSENFYSDIRKIEDTLNVKVTVLKTPYFDVSSTMIRRMIVDNDEELKKYVPEDVVEYIFEHNLYR